ncbi:MAG: GTP-binding protein, partial [Calditrichae bacterium]|nr:GTP-binding protein [Calditrichia bacterium]
MNLPVVAIIGRPNVGKSTLFNRIIKKRAAIVDDQPGVTRDRLYAETDWQGQSFLMVDTGGYLPQANQEMDRAIQEQIEIAIEESDLILYVVEWATGITDWDADI